MARALPPPLPETKILALGLSTPMPSLRVAVFQENPLVSEVIVPEPLKKAICPEVPDPVIPPPAPAQLPVEIQTMPEALGNVQLWAAVKSAEVKVPVKAAPPPVAGARAKVSELAVEEVNPAVAAAVKVAPKVPETWE